MSVRERAAPATAPGRAFRLPPRAPDGRFVAIPTVGAHGIDLDAPGLYVNRELSWLEFNRRVLALAADSTLPLLERLRHIARFHANLDQFFMVRVAGLKRLVRAGVTEQTPDGRTPADQLEAIAARLRPMLSTATTTLHEQLLRLLRRHGVGVVAMADLNDRQRAEAVAYFEHDVFPVLTPLAVDPGRPFPYISNLSISLAVDVVNPTDGTRQFARVKVPRVLPRFVPLQEHTLFVPLEELIRNCLDRLFPGLDVRAAHTFRVTRNADFELAEDGADDLLLAIEEELRKRRFGAVVRLEVDSAVPDTVTSLLQDELGVSDADTYRISGLLGCDDLVELADLERPRLRWRPPPANAHPRLPATAHGGPPDLFSAIRERDLVVHHPFHSFAQSVERLLAQAADDPNVLAIKMTLYRTSGDSPIVDALVHAAEQGKQVVVLVELKARFAEEANIVWARTMESAGVHVVYGLLGLKTHAKIALVVRRDRDRIRHYVHVGTGNYNPLTARYYTDLGLLSSDRALGADLTELFNVLTGYGRQTNFRKLVVAPWGMRERVGALIEREIDAQRSGDRPGRIRMQLNGLADQPTIAALYRASRAGVRIDLVVRGICALRPGIPGVSEHIEVRSVLGRFFEHARILQFGPDVFIGSADLMPRNLDRRVEVLVPIDEPAVRAQLGEVLDLLLADNAMAWRLDPGGSWARIRPRAGEPSSNAQDELLRRARVAPAGD